MPRSETKLKRNRDAIREYLVNGKATLDQIADRLDISRGCFAGIMQRYKKRLSGEVTYSWEKRYDRSQRFGKTSEKMPLEIWELPYKELFELTQLIDARYDEEHGWLLPYFIADMEQVHLPIQEWMRRLRLVGEELRAVRHG